MSRTLQAAARRSTNAIRVGPGAPIQQAKGLDRKRVFLNLGLAGAWSLRSWPLRRRIGGRDLPDSRKGAPAANGKIRKASLDGGRMPQ